MEMDNIDLESQKKRGKFNASMAFRLLSEGKDGELFGDSAWNYITETAIQMVTRREDYIAIGNPLAQIEHGKLYEYEAYLHYMQENGRKNVRYFGHEKPVIVAHNDISDEFGCYPDGGVITDDGNISLGIEIKCPYDPLLHFDRLKWKDQIDIQVKYSACYAQIQANLMFTGAEEWHFISYDYRQIIDKFKIKVISVSPDLKFQENLLFRIKQAVKEKYHILSEYLGAEVLNRSDFIDKITLLH